MADSRTEHSLHLNKDPIKETMAKADIPLASIAFVGDGRTIHTDGISITGKESTSTVARDAVFGAASLSKPVFAYLVLKLVSQKKISLDTKLNDIFPFADFCELNGFSFDSSITNDTLKKVDVKMLLSHSSGLNLPNDKPIESQFAAGTEYSYSNLGLFYLQKAIEHVTGKNLQALAHEYVFGPDALDMKSTCYYRDYELCKMSEQKRERNKIYLSSGIDGLSYEVIGLDGELKKDVIPWDKTPKDFPANINEIIDPANKCLPEILNHTSGAGFTSLKSAVAANSLFTTAHDYAKFVDAWMHDKDPILQSAFEPVIFMTTDDWAKKLKIDSADLRRVAWGLGWGLQTDENGKRSTHAYHTADMNMWRAQVAIDLHNKRAVVYFANSKNGHILADQIITPNIEIKHAHNYFFQKYGYARKIEANWEAKEDTRMQHIDAIVNSRNLVRSQVASSDIMSMVDDFPIQSKSPSSQPVDMPILSSSVKSRVEKIESDIGKSAQAGSHELSSTAKLHRRIPIDKKSTEVYTVEPESLVKKEEKNLQKSEKTEINPQIESEKVKGADKSESSHKPRTPFDSVKGLKRIKD